jgi:hypothetical protein
MLITTTVERSEQCEEVQFSVALRARPVALSLRLLDTNETRIDQFRQTTTGQTRHLATESIDTIIIGRNIDSHEVVR